MSPSRYQIPDLFGIVRTYPSRAPSLQFFTATAELGLARTPRPVRSIGVRSSYDSYSLIRSLPQNLQHQIDPDVEVHRSIEDAGIYILRYKHAHHTDIREVYYWHLPFKVYSRTTGQMIPVLEFQYRSWIPTDSHWSIELPLNPREVLEILSEINQLRTEQIRRMEDSTGARPVWNSMISLGVGAGRAGSGPDDWDDRLTGSPDEFVGALPLRRARPQNRLRTPTPPSQRTQPTIIERVVERVVVQVQPLPKPVGDVLLSNARKGADSCPITALPFAECESLCVTSCFHIFEAASMSRWRETHTTCPVCRSAIQNIVSETA
jgi:hypothetical protein